MESELPLGSLINEEIISEEELTDMFGEGGKEEVKEYYENNR